MKKVILFFAGFIFSFHAIAQSDYFSVTGKVIDNDTKKPMQSASVFAQNTTMGTVTDAQGNFTLYLPPGGYDLIVTYTGYSPEIKRISSSDSSYKNISFELKEKNKMMEAVVIAGTNEVKDGWKQYGEFFTDNFIGKTLFSSSCHILNPDELKFHFSKRKNRLKVLAATPIEITNDALGYKIKYTLDSFTYDYNTQSCVFAGYPLFEEMQSTDSNQIKNWHVNRMQAYHGSMLHFMRSVYNKNLKEEDFEIQFLLDFNGADTAIHLSNYYAALNYSKNDSTLLVDIKPNQQNVIVIYGGEMPEQRYLPLDSEKFPKKYQFSVMSVAKDESITIEQNGYFYDQNDITLTTGYWTWQKVGDMLPYDFVPD